MSDYVPDRAIEMIDCCCPTCGRLFAHLPNNPDGSLPEYEVGTPRLEDKLTPREVTCVGCGWVGVIVDARRI